MAADRRAVLAGFAGAVVVLAALVAVVGAGELLAALSAAEPRVLPAIVVAAFVWLAAWGLALRTVLGALSVGISAPRSVFVYAGALFANNVTPFGQAGGEPITAFLLTQATDTDYETGLAAIASADAVNVVPSVGFALVGLAYLSAVATLDAQLQVAAGIVVGFAVAVSVGGVLAWRKRRRIEAAVAAVFVPLARGLGRVLPRLSAPTPEAIRRRVRGFFGSIETVADDRRRLAGAVGLSALGWFAQMCSLWLSLYAVGVAAPVAAVLVAVPLGAFAGVTFLPGGLGGVEAVLVAALLPLVGASGATVLAAVFLHRGAIYWLPTLAGGGVVAAVGVGTVGTSR